MIRKSPTRIALVAAALASLTLTACAGGTASTPAPQNSAGVTLISPDKLTTCTHLSYKPFQYRDASNQIVGFDVELVDLVAEELGVEQEIIDIEFEQITSGAAFAAGKCDIGAAATTITDARREAVLFSVPYFEATQALLVKADSGIDSLEDLRGKSLGVQTGTTGQIFAQENAAQYGYEVVVFDDGPLTLNGALSGRVEASINDNGVVLDFAKENPTLTMSAEFDTDEQYGFFAAKDENGTKLIEVVDATLSAAKADGRYAEIFEKYFGAAPTNIPIP